MSSLPDSKPIGRADLESQSSSDPQASPSPTLENRLREQLERLYDRDELQDQGASEGGKAPPAGTTRDESAEVYNFRLFTRPAKSVEPGLANAECQSLQRIALRSPTPVNSEPGFVKPRRPDEYYFTGIPSVRQLEQFRQAAVSGEHILKGLNTIWPGSAMPWRVTVLKSSLSNTRLNLMANQSSLEQDPSRQKKRSGKKRRIAIRKRLEATSAQELASRQSLAEKEAAEREKRTRKNREKKVKRKLKEKVEKSKGAQGVG